MTSDRPGQRRLVAGWSIRWDDRAAEQAYRSGAWVTATLADDLREAAARTPERVLLVDGELRLDCRTIQAEANALAGAMAARAPVGSVVSYVLPNWHEAAVIYLAATMAGLVVNPIMPSLGERELHFILEDVGSRLVFVPSSFRGTDFAALLERIAARLPSPPDVVVLRGDAAPHLPYAALLEASPPMPQLPLVDPDAVRMVLYTSGTTGRPKGVLHTHNSIHALMTQIKPAWLVDPGDIVLVPSPIGHITGSMCAIEAPLLLGATAVLMDQWDADRAVALLERERATHMAGATPFLEQLLGAARRAGTRLPSLKFFACGGASVPPSLVREAAEFFERAVVCRVYGSTEVPLISAGVSDRDDVAHAAETDGRPRLAEARLVAHPAAPPGEGEIHARGPQMLLGYLRREDEADAFDDEGFFRTGDIARWVDGDYLVVTGRAKDIIIRNGENISPKEIEDLLIRHPDIDEVTVVGVPDPRTGERACAVIVRRGHAVPDVAGIAGYLAGLGVAKFKFPEQVELRDALPKNAAGKVLKHELRAELAGQGD